MAYLFIFFFLNNEITLLLYRKKSLISDSKKQNKFINFRTNDSIKLIHRAYLYLTIEHEGLGSTGSSPQSDRRAVI